MAHDMVTGETVRKAVKFLLSTQNSEVVGQRASSLPTRGSHVKDEISGKVQSNETESGEGEGKDTSKTSSHVFQRRVDPNRPVYQYMSQIVRYSRISVEKFKIHFHVSYLIFYTSPKLVALQEILEECGIGVEASTSEGSVSVGQHRVLIFAQHKALLDIIEKDLFHAHMKSVTYLRLDGSV
nr:hypothetical protein [Tanacetum cinerariifolium]